MPAPAVPLWLVRHAPTNDNVGGVIMGQRDPEVTDGGLDGVAGLLPEIAWDRVVSSDARRAQATARAIAPPDSAITLDERLRERSFGAWEGRTKAELTAAYPDVLTETGAVRLDADIPGLEPTAAFVARVHAALADLRDCAGPLLVVAHNGSLRVAMVLLGLSTFDAASASSLPHLSPVAADLATLRERASVA